MYVGKYRFNVPTIQNVHEMHFILRFSDYFVLSTEFTFPRLPRHQVPQSLLLYLESWFFYIAFIRVSGNDADLIINWHISSNKRKIALISISRHKNIVIKRVKENWNKLLHARFGFYLYQQFSGIFLFLGPWLSGKLSNHDDKFNINVVSVIGLKTVVK